MASTTDHQQSCQTYTAANLAIQPGEEKHISKGKSIGVMAKMLWAVKNRDNYHPLKLYHPYDVTFLWDGRVALVEGFYPYSRIQVLDQSGNCMNSIAQGDIMPYGITSDSEGYLAITDHKDRTVKFYTPDGRSALSWKTNMFDWPDGIACTKSGNYVVSDWTRGTVSIHDISGTEIRKFATVNSKTSDVKSCPAYVTIDRTQRIILTDNFDHSVKIFSKTGELLKTFGNNSDVKPDAHRIEDPRGVTTDCNGNIYVAEWQKDRVSQFSSDGRFIQYILSEEDIQYPWGIAVNHQGLLCVSEQKLNAKPALKMYQIQNI